jgi:N-acyl homoserine lactone hydrolase
LPPHYATDPDAGRKDGLDAFGRVLTLGPENTVEGQLARLGLRPDDVDMVVLTHGHIDHVGGLGFFPRATLVLAAAERALARPRYWGDVQPMAWPDMPTLTIDRDTVLCDGLTLLMAPGHVSGQLAVLVDLPETGAMLLASDAISRPGEVAEGFAGADDPGAARASATRLVALAETLGARVIYGHDPEQWLTLRKAPDGYC